MIRKYKTVSIIYGGSGKRYAAALNEKIKSISRSERYPISAKLILESILTKELLSGVVQLFKESEICVAFLTADDCYPVDGGMKKRLRQNVVFELGMAILQLGRERCILLCDFDPRAADIELPSDMNSLEIKQFSPDSLDAVTDEVIAKILSISAQRESATPQYDELLLRKAYYVDYENLFHAYQADDLLGGKNFLNKILDEWGKECASLAHYDEKCVYLLERLGFIPMFGRTNIVLQWLDEAMRLIEYYSQEEVEYYHGNTALLDFARDVLVNIVSYTRIKTEDAATQGAQFSLLLDDFLFIQPPDEATINPLLLVAYYDYLGLTYMRVYNQTKEETYILAAKDAFEKSASFTDKVDMSLQIWSGFLHFNVARAYAILKEQDKAAEHFQRAIRTRKRWLSTSRYNVTIRSAMSGEYFVAKIGYINFQKQFRLLSQEELQREYDGVETELNTYSEASDSLDKLLHIRRILNESRFSE